MHHNVAGKQIGSTFKFDRVSCVDELQVSQHSCITATPASMLYL